jgi:hypothetical protein
LVAWIAFTTKVEKFELMEHSRFYKQKQLSCAFLRALISRMGRRGFVYENPPPNGLYSTEIDLNDKEKRKILNIPPR